MDVCYLASFDCAHGSVRWPQKDPKEARAYQGEYEGQISAILKLNLLFRPFVSVRHMDLFDNLALAKFLTRQTSATQALGEARLLRVSVPSRGEFEEVFENWALGKGKGSPQHFHHLNHRQQRVYDAASRGGRLKTIEDISGLLQLHDHDLDLHNLLESYDSIFPPSARIVLPNRPPLREDWYAKRVEEKWNQHLQKQGGLNPHSLVTWHIGRALENCWKRGKRRRAFYTELEKLESQLRYMRRTSPYPTEDKIEDEINGVKCFVLNDAFYDEFEKFDQYDEAGKLAEVRIRASRDVGLPLIPPVLPPELPFLPTEENLLAETPMRALEAITLEDISRWHIGSDAEAVAFKQSVDRIARLRLEACVRRIEETEAQDAARRHLACIRECAKRSSPDLVEDSVWKVYFGLPVEAVATLAELGVRYYVAPLLAIHGESVLFEKAASFLVQVTNPRATTAGWRQAQLILEEELERYLDPEQTHRAC